MSKSILISIRPEFVEKILNGEKTLEIRKTMPKCELPCKVYIYCTKSQKKLLTIFRKGDLIWGDDKDEQRFDETIFVKDDYFSIADKRHRWLGKVVAEFTLMHYTKFDIPFPAYWKDLPDYVKEEIPEKSCLSLNELHHYLDDKTGYAWHIEDLHIYDQPKELAEFGLKRPFQSWGYLEDE